MLTPQKKNDCIRYIKNTKGDRAADWVKRVIEAMDEDTADHYVRSLLYARPHTKAKEKEEEEIKEEKE